MFLLLRGLVGGKKLPRWGLRSLKGGDELIDEKTCLEFISRMVGDGVVVKTCRELFSRAFPKEGDDMLVLTNNCRGLISRGGGDVERLLLVSESSLLPCDERNIKLL